MGGVDVLGPEARRDPDAWEGDPPGLNELGSLKSARSRYKTYPMPLLYP